MINSHIVLPKFLLKNFEIVNFFWFYDTDRSFIAKGHASSFNTEKGYYSDGTEQVLNSAVETPFSNLVKSYMDPIVGWEVWAEESAEHASELIRRACAA